MKLNFTLHIDCEDDKRIFKEFAVEKKLMWDTSISVNNPADDSFDVLVTDNANDAKTALQNKREQSEIVFCGKIADVEEVYSSLLDVWPQNESSNIRKQRIEKLLQHLQNRFDSFHYQNLLTTAIDSVPDLV